MNKKEAQEYINYEIRFKGSDEPICLCKDLHTASVLAETFAMNTKDHNVVVCVTSISEGSLDFVPGGGWVDYYWRDEKGVLRKSGIS